MPPTSLIIDFVVVSVAALAGGMLAQRLRLPTVVGFLVAGLALSPLLPSGDLGRVQTLADIGVALLMFALGIEFSPARLRSVGRVSVLGGAVQIIATVAFGILLGFLLGFDLVRSLYWGCLISLSSTTIVLKLLQNRGELHTPHGEIAIGILVVQDLAVVPMTILLPALASPVGAPLLELAGAFAKAALLLVGVYFLGSRIVPWLLNQVASPRQRELLPLAVIAIGLGTAAAAAALGLSLAFGAFLAGLVISGTQFEYQILAEVRPLRDVFASLFFVSIGLLMEPGNLIAQLPLVIAVSVAVALGKLIIVTAVPLAFGYPGRVALPVGLGLMQIGEFSFVLASLGVAQAIIPRSLYSLTLAVSLVTMLLTPVALHSAAPLLRALCRVPALRRAFLPRFEVQRPVAEDSARRHAVILGYGRVGLELADVLEARGFSWLAVDLDLKAIRVLRERGMPHIYGDAAELEVLRHAGLDQAQLLAVALPDVASAERAIRHARELNPTLPIIARARDRVELRRLVIAGAEEVVHPEFEAALEFVRYALRRFGVSGAEVQHLLSGRRFGHYLREREE